LDILLQIDRDLLLWLNSNHSVLWDNFFWLFTSTGTWVPFYAALVYVFLKQMGLRGLWPILAIVVVIVLCDQISSSVFKVLFERLRPSHEPSLDGLVHLVYGKRGGSFGFVSSHAANSMGLALFTALLFRNWGFSLTVFLWALLNSYSRIYLGLHYPGDILGGWILGILVALLVYWVYGRLGFNHHQRRLIDKNGIGQESLIPIGILATISFVVFISARVFSKVL
jgi:undecaprenyl-diphosphatase